MKNILVNLKHTSDIVCRKMLYFKYWNFLNQPTWELVCQAESSRLIGLHISGLRIADKRETLSSEEKIILS